MAMPYLGMPATWKQYLYIGLGIVIVLVGYSVRRAQYLREIDLGNGHRGGETFVESTESLFATTDGK